MEVWIIIAYPVMQMPFELNLGTHAFAKKDILMFLKNLFANNVILHG